MALIFRDLADPIHKIERLLEIWEAELAVNVMLIIDRPLGDASVKVLQFFSMKGRHATSAGHAILVSQVFRHRSPDPTNVEQQNGFYCFHVSSRNRRRN